jgi:hypothetical protein
VKTSGVRSKVSPWRTLRTFPFKVLGHGAALADPYPPVRINGDVALIKALLEYMLEGEGKGRPQESTVRLSLNTQKGLRLSARMLSQQTGTHC